MHVLDQVYFYFANSWLKQPTTLNRGEKLISAGQKLRNCLYKTKNFARDLAKRTQFWVRMQRIAAILSLSRRLPMNRNLPIVSLEARDRAQATASAACPARAARAGAQDMGNASITAAKLASRAASMRGHLPKMANAKPRPGLEKDVLGSSAAYFALAAPCGAPRSLGGANGGDRRRA